MNMSRCEYGVRCDRRKEYIKMKEEKDNEKIDCAASGGGNVPEPCGLWQYGRLTGKL